MFLYITTLSNQDVQGCESKNCTNYSTGNIGYIVHYTITIYTILSSLKSLPKSNFQNIF